MLPTEWTLLLATFLCTLVAGFLLAFLVVVMPGIGTLDDGPFIAAFQAMDRVIQGSPPVFLLMWAGSLVALLGAAVSGWVHFDGLGRALLASATLVHLLGVQLPTIVVNVPLNNGLQALQVEAMDPMARRLARVGFEARWNRWNAVRTVLACVTSGLLILLLGVHG